MNTHNDKMTLSNLEAQIHTLQQSHISIAAKMMAATFFPDPLSCYLVPNERYRLESLEKAWLKTINHDFPLGHVYCCEQSDRHVSTTLDNSPILAIASWLPPNANSPSLLGSLPLLWEILLQNGFISIKRILNTLTKTEAYRLRDCPTPHWYLEGLGVSPKAQGQGIGGLILQPVLQHADRQGEICYLFTSTDRAVKFYQRHGFMVREELRVLDDAPPLWMMMRLPQA
jgi:hypothetical protein